ncbi:M48 family metalloprotease [Halococcus dombrowskii]|uniref:M48 family metalloprotease n=1 Tax=Halococcus dombrowskii TaxID=179637 RepID=A0AAX3AS83_HALDO|nr:M48 family metalloprotease [Halococcus dombrowskii]UOO96376.1 M48 family metalloprotease [Halococcus dombrowskii]
MSVSSRRPRGVAVLAGVWLLALAGIGVLVGSELFGALLADGALPSVLFVAVGFALLFGYLGYRTNSKRLLSRLDVTPLTQSRAPQIHASVDRLAQRMEIDRPEIYLGRLGQPNAFALGSDTLVVDQSLVRLLTPTELEGVLAHEFAHLEGYDSLLRTLATSLLRTVTSLLLILLVPLVIVVSLIGWGLSLIVGRPMRGPDSVGSGLRSGLQRLVKSLLVAPTLALQAYARRREYAADRRAVAVLDDPLALARALQKIQRANEPDRGLLGWLLPSRDRETERSPTERALASHPPTDERVERVREAANAAGSEGSTGWHRVDID